MGSLKWSNLHSRYDVRITLMGKLNEQPTHLYITKANSLCKINLGKLWEMVRDRDREAWCAVTHGVAKSRTQLADWTMSQILELWQVPKLFLWSEVKWMKVTQSCLDSLQPHGLYSPRNYPRQNTGVGSRFLLQGIFPTRGWNPGLLHCRQIHYKLSHKGSQVAHIPSLPK